MKQIFRKHFISILVSIVLCVSVFLVFTYIFSKIRKDITNVLDSKEKLLSYQINKKAFNDEVLKIKGLEERLSVLEKNIIKKDSIPNLLSSIESLADQKGVVFEITSVDDMIEDKQKFSINTRVSGQYEKIINFFNSLENQSFLSKVSSISLSLDSSGGESSLSDTTNKLVVKEPKWQGTATIEILSIQ